MTRPNSLPLPPSLGCAILVFVFLFFDSPIMFGKPKKAKRVKKQSDKTHLLQLVFALLLSSTGLIRSCFAPPSVGVNGGSQWWSLVVGCYWGHRAPDFEGVSYSCPCGAPSNRHHDTAHAASEGVFCPYVHILFCIFIPLGSMGTVYIFYSMFFPTVFLASS